MVSALPLILALGVIALAYGYDTNQDWISGITAKGENGCTFVPKPNNMDAPTCVPPTRTITKEDVASVAWKLAPKMYFHPLEWYRLSDPVASLKRVPIFNITASNWTLDNITSMQAEKYFNTYQTRTGPMNVASLLIDPQMQNFSTDYLNQRTAGDPVNSNGSSTGKVHFTIGDPGEFNTTMTNAFVITYHYYYDFNGCSNQLFAMNVDGKFQGNEYFMCSPGVHEGDLERITLYVCQSDIEALMADTSAKIDSREYTQWIQYAAHSWSNTYNCQEGQCNGEETPDGITRPQAYAGLFSHASYPWPSPLVVYQKVGVNLPANIEGMYIGDRTSDQGAYFIPTPENTLYIKSVDDMTDTERYGDLKWGAYSGSWGGSFVNTEGYTLTCLYNNLTTMGPCDEENPATSVLKWGLERTESVSLDLSTMPWTCNVPYDKPQEQLPNFDLRGPNYRDYAYMWRWDRPAPIWADGNEDATYTCPFSGDPGSTNSDGYSYTSTSIDIYAFLGAIAGLLIGCAVLYGLLLWLFVYNEPIPDSLLSGEDSSGIAKEERKQRKFEAVRALIWWCCTISLYITGMVLCAIGINDVFDALEAVISVSLWETLKKTFIAVVALFGIVQLIFIIFTIFIRRQDFVLWSGKQLKNPVAWQGASKTGYVMQAAFSVVIILMINTTMLLCSFGFFMWILRFLFELACDSALSQLASFANGIVNDICLDLSIVGIDTTFCGSELTQLCGIWSGLNIDYVIFGCFIFILSHCMFLTSSAFTCQSLHQQVMEDNNTKEDLPDMKKISDDSSTLPEDPEGQTRLSK